ncbi:MAG: cytidine/deoxycytidylate deaminase family protein [Verrucomicrobiota bacterium]|nr:cytidine/deoxycytidylate deaminase family protein [Verrucomicrobiota bacterium]
MCTTSEAQPDSAATASPSSAIPSLIDQVAGILHDSPRPSWDEYFMATAMLIASRSACERLHVGCVLVSSGQHKNRIIAAGYNGFLPGTPHTSRVRDGHEQATVHAEQNAIADAARRGISVEGATAYVSHFPCINCAKILAASGIKEIKYHGDYRNDPLVTAILNDAGVVIVQLK